MFKVVYIKFFKDYDDLIQQAEKIAGGKQYYIDVLTEQGFRVLIYNKGLKLPEECPLRLGLVETISHDFCLQCDDAIYCEDAVLPEE